jgi:hypothetical protein
MRDILRWVLHWMGAGEAVVVDIPTVAATIYGPSPTATVYGPSPTVED